MSFWKWFFDQFEKDGKLGLSAVVTKLATEVYYKELAVQACANLTAQCRAQSQPERQRLLARRGVQGCHKERGPNHHG